MELYVYREIASKKYYKFLKRLKQAIEDKKPKQILESYAKLLNCLLKNKAEDLPTMLARDLLFQDSVLATAVLADNLALGLELAAKQDLTCLAEISQLDWKEKAQELVDKKLPEIADLARPDPKTTQLKELLLEDSTQIYDYLINAYQEKGSGVLARYEAFAWDKSLQVIKYPVDFKLADLVALDEQIAVLLANTQAFLAKKLAHNCLLYGPKGSGKSTIVRALLPKFKKQGLRMIELSASNIYDLGKLTESLRFSPLRYIIFIDDLSFNSDGDYGPLKSILEGSLSQRSDNILIYATSNRRHIIKENFSDRPDPLNDDVHAWDSHNEKLALSDRFGLSITFPNPSQRRYLAIVQVLAEQVGLDFDKQKAIHFADWGNGYSGRTARQFVDSLMSELV